jgi:DNA polymerase-3 subunit epsilon
MGGTTKVPWIITDDFTAIDVETTGRSAENDEITELAAVKYRTGQQVEVFQRLVKPHEKIEEFVENLTGITNAMVQDAPDIAQVLPEFIAFVGDDVIVGHNVNFDLQFVNASCKRLGLPPLKNDFVDTLFIGRKTNPEWPNHRLATIAQQLGIEADSFHRADNDAAVTAKVYMAMKDMPESATAYKPHGSKRKFEKLKVSDIKPEVQEIDDSNPLFGKSIVFTGEMSISREEAAQLAVNCGALLRGSVSSKTDFLVVGAQDNSIVGDDGMSNKEEKAAALNSSGKGHVKILKEDEFMAMVKENVKDGRPVFIFQ